MKLTLTERLIISNQYRILEKLYPNEAKNYQSEREIVESGYELHYDSLVFHLDKDVMTEEECREVWDILTMFSALQESYASLADKTGIDKQYRIALVGFDGNNERKQMDYANYLIKYEKYPILEHEEGFNSHIPTLPRYRAMLSEWHRSPNQNELSKEDIIRITSVDAPSAAQDFIDRKERKSIQ